MGSAWAQHGLRPNSNARQKGKAHTLYIHQAYTLHPQTAVAGLENRPQWGRWTLTATPEHQRCFNAVAVRAVLVGSRWRRHHNGAWRTEGLSSGALCSLRVVQCYVVYLQPCSKPWVGLVYRVVIQRGWHSLSDCRNAHPASHQCRVAARRM